MLTSACPKGNCECTCTLFLSNSNSHLQCIYWLLILYCYEPTYDVCIRTRHVFSSSSDFTHLWELAELCFTAWGSSCQQWQVALKGLTAELACVASVSNRVIARKVWAEAKKRLKGEGEERRGNTCPQTPRFWKTPLDISRFGSFVNWQLVKIET